MSLKPTPAQTVQAEAIPSAVVAAQPIKMPTQSAAPAGKFGKRALDDDEERVEQASETGSNGDINLVVGDPVEHGAGAVHLAQAGATTSDAAPAAAGSVPAGEGAGAAAMAGMNTGLLIAGGVLVVAAAASGGGGGSSSAEVAPSIVTGTVVGGPVVPDNELTVNLYRADGTTLLGTGTVNAAGQFTIDVGSYTGVVIARVVNPNANPDYIDEATGQPVDLSASLMAVGVANTGTVTLNINPLTTLAAMKAGDNPSANAVNQANAAVAQAFGITDLTGAVVITTVDASGNANDAYDPADGLSNSEKYGAILAALSGMDQSAGAQATLDALAANLDVDGATGALNATALEAILDGAASADGNTAGSLIAVVSDILARSSASISIDTVAGDNAINAAEIGAGVTLTGTNAAGATVALDIAGNTRDATVTGTTWSYTLVADDYAAMGEGGETLTATATLTTGSGATATTTTANASRAITIDSVAPTLDITSNDTALIAGENAIITFTFSEAPVGFSATDVVATEGTLSGLSVTADAKVYTATFTPTPNLASGNASITVAAGSYTDAAGNAGGSGAAPAIAIDTLAPTVTVTRDADALKIGETATITFSFSEVPSGFDAADITAVGGAVSNLTVTGNPAVYTATFTPTAGFEGNASLSVAAGGYTDAAGNAGGAGAMPTITVDTLAPTVTITSNVAALKIGEMAVISFTFSEAPAGFAADDVATAGGTLGGFAATANPTVYTATFTPTADFEGAASITVAAGSYGDAAGNAGGAGSTPVIAIDTLAPTVTINPVTGDNVINASEHANAVTISGTTTGVEDGQSVTVQINAQSYDATVNGNSWSLSVPAAHIGALADLTTYPVTANVSDLAGNPAPQASQSVLVAISGPVIQIDPIAGDDYLNAAEKSGAMVISGTVSGADGQTLTVNLNGQAYTSVVTAGGWSVTVDAGTVGALADGNYNVTADVSDSTGNPAAQAGRMLIVDTFIATPTVALANDNGVSDSDGLTNDASLNVSAPAADVTRSFSINGGAAAANYTEPVADGVYTVLVNDTDTAGNTASASVTFTLDKTLDTPTLALTNDTGISDSDRITSDAALTFSAPAADVTRSFTVNGGAPAANYTAPGADGSHTVVVTDSDTAGNTRSASITFTLDTTAPTVTVSNTDISADSGPSANDFYTSATAQTVTGTLSSPLAAGDTVHGTVDNGTTWTDITDKVSGTAINWDGATLTPGSDTIGFRVTDSAGNTGAMTGTQAYTVDATAPVFTSGASASFAHLGTGTAYTAAATDASAVTYSLAGTDAALFDIDTNTGVVTFKTPPDTAAPADAGADNVYNFTVVATDLAGNSTQQAVAITVVNAPTLLPSALDNVTNFEVTSPIVLLFSEGIQAVAGKSLHLINDGGVGFRGESTNNSQSILVTDASQISIVGNKLIINPTFDLDLANNYHIEIDEGAFLGVDSGLPTAAFDGTSSLNFATVTPGGFALALAAESQAMNADGEMVTGRKWLDIEGIGSFSNAASSPLDLGDGNYALVAKDHDPAGADANSGYDGIRTGNFWVGANNFGPGDLIYFDDQTNNPANANDLSMTILNHDGNAPTQVQLAGLDLGGFIDITLAGNSAGYDTIALMEAALGTTAIVSA